MELQGERLIPASVDTTWAALNDPDELKACIAGCESLERTGDDALQRAGRGQGRPGQRALQGQPEDDERAGAEQLHDQLRRAGRHRRLRQGLGRRRADARGPQQTLLDYAARAQVGGKLAQVGSRLIDAAAAKIADDFFKAFEARLQARQAPVPAPAATRSEPTVDRAGPAGAPARAGRHARLGARGHRRAGDALLRAALRTAGRSPAASAATLQASGRRFASSV